MRSEFARFSVLAVVLLTVTTAWPGAPASRLAADTPTGEFPVPPRARFQPMTISLTPSAPAPGLVGGLVEWTAAAGSPRPGAVWYRFRVRPPGGDFLTVRDFGPNNKLDWTAAEREGDYEIEVTARDIETGEVAVASVIYEMSSRVTGADPVISPTANPLVFLYSAPACAEGGRMRVQFQGPDGIPVNTPYKACTPGLSMNFYLAGMRPETQYAVKHTIDSGSSLLDGPTLSVTTPAFDLGLPAYTPLQQPPDGMHGVLLQATLFMPTMATDLAGNLLWFYTGKLSYLTRAEPGGLFLGLVQDPDLDPSYQMVREFDLAGTVVQETNAARVSEQLVALGKRPITSFHHDARRLPDGSLLVLASSEQLMTDVQGAGTVDVLGDTILVLDKDLQVSWVWDSFDHLDPRRLATLNETCTPQGGGCPPFYLAPQANDWLHGNSVQYTPDGNILYSARHQDLLFKIDYTNGQGSGSVIWRLGKDGDFHFNSTDPYPWFSHQHDAQFEAGDNSTLMVFDNGNTRQALDASAHSRGQVLRLDEQNRVAEFVTNADLGGYARALGSTQKLPGGDYHFGGGWFQGDVSRSAEVKVSGEIVYAIQAGTLEYRTYRMVDMYTP